MPPPPGSSTASSAPGRKSFRSLIFIVINGLIVSIAAFLLLRLFVSEAVRLNEAQQYETIQTTLTSDLRAFDEHLAPFPYLMKLDPDFTNLSQYIETQKIKGDFAKLKFLYWWPKQADIGYPGRVIHGDTTKGFAALSAIKTAVETHLQQATLAPLTPELVSLDTIFPPETINLVSQSSGWSRIKDNTIAIVYDVYHADGRAGWMVAVIPLREVLDLPALTQKIDVRRIVISNKSGQTLMDTYPVALSTDPERATPALAAEGLIPLMLPNSQTLPLNVWAQLDPTRENILLSSIPNVMLIFGFILTGFGSLFVHGNMRQSEVMRQVNRTLALKNLEMNAQAAERDRLNQVLRRTEHESRAIMNAVSDVIFELDEHGKILFLNACWSTLTGQDIHISLGSNLFDHLDDPMIETLRQQFSDMITSGAVSLPVSTRMKRPDDTNRLVDIRFTMVRKDDPKHPRIVGTITDVDDQVRAQKTILAVEEKYRAFWENSPSGIYQINPSGKIISANPALARMFGYETADLLLNQIQSVQDQLYANPRDYHELMRDIHNKKIITNLEREAKRRDGTLFWVFESARGVYDENGKLIYIEGSLDDITERKQAVETLQSAKNEAELANRSKTEFLANMSHELRTPLNAIIGFSEIIKDQILGPLGQEQYLAYARDIHDSGKNLLSVINTILDVARIEAGERQLNEDQVHLNTVVDTVVELMRPKILNANQTIDITLPTDLPPLLAEELAVKQILLNLLSNAIKFTPFGGHIKITAADQKEAGLHVAVTDTGIGLDTEEIARIMAPFGQVSGRFDRASSGPGLGLTLVHSLMRLHGGTFDILSQKGVGTTVSVIFPNERLLRQR